MTEPVVVGRRLTIGLLGPLKVSIDGQPVTVPRGKLRCILAELALTGGRALQASRLAERTWGLDLPRRPKSSVQNVVLRLRRTLGADLIRTVGTGYRLNIGPDDVDVLLFGRLLTEAANEERNPERARDLLTRATGLWRGEPFSDIGSPELENDQGPVLTERFLSAVEQRVDIDLTDRAPGDLIPELRQLTGRFPLRESLWERLLTALYRAGRQAEALDAYEGLRRSLADRLGADPSQSLQRLHYTILNGGLDPSGSDARARPGAPAAAAVEPEAAQREQARPEQNGGDQPAVPATDQWRAAPDPELVVPAQLPFDTADFVGRTDEVATVAGWLSATRESGLIVGAISGPGGMGKTTLAVHVAHRVSGRYPDGHLFARLIDADGEPREPRDVLAVFLRALGTGAALVPESLEERAALFRSKLRGRRLLVVLDDALGEDQVRPLLPGTPESGVLITSRSRPVGIPGARHLGLVALDDRQALDLLYAASGRERREDERRDAERIVEACGRLPLAIRIAGSRLAARPHWRLRGFADRLSDERGRLDELSQGDLEVRANLGLSYRGIDETSRLGFRRLGLLDAPGFPSWVLGAVLDDPAYGTDEGMESLVEAQLLEVEGYDDSGRLRCRFHDLVRLYAREQATDSESEQERRAAVTRVLEGYLASAERAAARIPRPFPVRVPMGSTAEENWRWGETPTDPYGWFDSEHTSLVSLTEQACELGLVEIAASLTSALSGFFDARGYFEEWRRINERALAVASRSGHTTATALLLCNLGEVHMIQDRIDEAVHCFSEALRLSETAGELTLHALASTNLGYLARLRSRYAEASQAYDQARTLALRVGDTRIQASATQGLGNIASDKGDLEVAQRHFATALRLSRESGFVVCAVRALRGMGQVAKEQGRVGKAIGFVLQALGEFGDHPTTLGEAHAWADLADLYVLDGRFEHARAIYDNNLRHFEEHGDRFGYAMTCHGLGELLIRIGQPDVASKHLEEAVRVFGELRLPKWENRSADALDSVRRFGSPTG